MGNRVVLALLILALGATARDTKAAKLEAKAIELGKSAEESWQKFVLERDSFTDDELSNLIEIYDEAVDLFHESLEIEEYPGINGQIVVVARRLAKLRFEEMRREAAKRPKPKPKPKPKPETGPAPERKPERAPEPGPKGETEETEESKPPWPELIETKKQKRRGIQALRNFLMHSYFANRKFSALIIRCSRCNGHRKVPLRRDPKTRQIIFQDCPQCSGTGAFLNETKARKAFWLTMSPLYRSRPGNRAAFNEKLANWKAHPSQIGEFLKGLSIGSIDYHGLWAVVKYKERGYSVETNKKFSRTVQRMFVRFGRRWFLYDEEADEAFLSPDTED